MLITTVTFRAEAGATFVSKQIKWIAEIEAGGWLVARKVFDTADEAREWIDSNPVQYDTVTASWEMTQ